MTQGLLDMTVLTLLRTRHIKKTAMLRIRLSILYIAKTQMMKKRAWRYRGERTMTSYRLVKYHNKRKEKREKKEGPETQAKKQRQSIYRSIDEYVEERKEEKEKSRKSHFIYPLACLLAKTPKYGKYYGRKRLFLRLSLVEVRLKIGHVMKIRLRLQINQTTWHSHKIWAIIRRN